MSQNYEALLQELESLQALNKSMTDVGSDDIENDDELLGKSLIVTDESGEEHEAVDGTELVKSLMDRMSASETSVEANSALMIKSMTVLTDLVKSLQGQVSAMGSEGRGRKSVLSITEKPDSATLQKSQPDGVSRDEFMAKAMDAQKSGRITGIDVSVAEGYLNKGEAVPEALVRRVLSL